MNATEVVRTNLSMIENNMTTEELGQLLGIEIPPEFLTANQVAVMVAEINERIDDLWMIIVALEVITMQLGFIMLEVGTIRSKNSRNIIYKNMVDTFVSTVTFWTLGYGQVYGS